MLAMTDPVTACEFVEQGTIQAARCPEVGVLNDGVLAQSGMAQSPVETFGVASGHLTVEQQAEPILAGEIGGGRGGLHFEERIGHGGHAEAAQALGQGMHQHRRLSFQW
jgi:hypothetical protein